MIALLIKLNKKSKRQMSQSFSNFHPPTLSFFIILTTSILFSPHTRTVLADNRICNLGDGVDPEFNDVQQFLSDRIISEPYPVTVNYNYELVTNWESGADKRANDVSVVETQLALLLLPKLFEECDNRNDRKTKRRAATNGSQNILYESYSVEADMLRSLEESSRIVGLSVLPKDVVDESDCSKVLFSGEVCTSVKGSLTIFSTSNDDIINSITAKEVIMMISKTKLNHVTWTSSVLPNPPITTNIETGISNVTITEQTNSDNDHTSKVTNWIVGTSAFITVVVSIAFTMKKISRRAIEHPSQILGSEIIV